MKGKYSSEDFIQAEKYYRKALSVRQGQGSAQRRLGHLHILQAQHELESGGDPRSAIRKAEEALNKAAKIEPDEYEVLVAKAQTEVLKARASIVRGNNAEKYFAQADKFFEEALKINPDYPQILLARSQRDFFEAEWKLKVGKDAKALVDRGLTTTENVLNKVAGSAQAYLIKGKLLLIKAQASKNSKERSEFAKNAAEALEKAVSMNSNLKRECDSLIVKSQSLL